MDPNKLPAGTEYAYAHSFMPHPYLGNGMAISPINPTRTSNTTFSLAELTVHNEKMTPPPRASAQAPRSSRRR